MSIESNDQNERAIAFAEARGQKPTEIPTLEEIFLKKGEIVNEEVFGVKPASVEAGPDLIGADPPKVIFNPGTCSI